MVGADKTDPERFRFHRSNPDEARLARLETRIALEAIQARLPNFELDAEGLVRVHSPNVRGFAAMPLRFSAA